MALPKRRHSKSRKNKRRSHDAISAPAYTNCNHCGALTKPHSVCMACGYYRDKQVIEIKEKKKK